MVDEIGLLDAIEFNFSNISDFLYFCVIYFESVGVVVTREKNENDVDGATILTAAALHF